MAIESDADRLEYVTTFGIGVTFGLGAENWDMYGILDKEFIDVNGVESTAPVLQCRKIDIYVPGELLNIEFRATSVNTGIGFNIVEVREDGVEMVVLILEVQ